MAETEPQYLYLTTKGRKTGLLREIEIWFTRRDERYYVIAEYSTSRWVHNLQADSRVKVRVGTKSFEGRARVVAPETEPELQLVVQEMSRQKYGWGDGMVVELAQEVGQRLG